MNKPIINLFYKGWRILNALLALFFLVLIANAWIQILYFKNAEKHYYYIATLFIIPLITCLISNRSQID
jgi:hypothetical protein